MPIATRTFRVFVSSTFEDLKAERDALQENVFPEVEKFCSEKGARFQAIDLRWGVREEAGLDQKAMQICLSEIARCQKTGIKPNFIVLLADRYGWRPLPTRIKKDEFEALLARATVDERKLLVFEEDQHSAEKGWYRLDWNANPPEYLLRPRDGGYEERSRWDPVEVRMRQALQTAARAAGLPHEALFKYGASATHQEILAGLGTEPTDREHVFAFLRNGDAPKDSELKGLIDALRRDLPKENVFPFGEGDLDVLCQQVTASLTKIIETEISRFHSKSALEQEKEAHQSFARDRCKHFVGRQSVRVAIDEYLNSNDLQPLAVHGPSGSGKSAIMARASEDREGIRRFIGATPEASSGLTLLRSLCREIGERYGQAGDLPATFNELVVTFQDRLKLATADRPLILYIDALDQLGPQDPAAAMNWLPRELPPYCRVVLSAIDVPAALVTAKLVPVEPFSVEEAGATLDLWLKDSARTLQRVQAEKLLESFSRSGLPLYLKLAFEGARLWRSFDPPDKCVLGEGLHGIIDRLFARLSERANHGAVLVSHALSYLTAARYGLTEDEMLDVLAANDAVWADFQRTKKHDLPGYMLSETGREKRQLPAVIWSRLYLDLEPYLAERPVPGGVTIGFYHRGLAEMTPKDRSHHAELATYFGRQSNWRGPQQANERKIAELVRQQAGAGLLDEVVATLTNPDFVAAKCAAELVFDLKEDYAVAAGILPEARAEVDERRQIQLAFDRWAQTVLECARNRRLPEPKEVISSVAPWTEEQITADATRSAENPTRLGKLRAFAAFVEQETYPLIQFGRRPGFVLQHAFNSAPAGPVHSASENAVESIGCPVLMKVWRGGIEYFPRQAVIRILEGHKKGVRHVSITPDWRLIVSAGWEGTIRVWDLQTGVCLRIIQTPIYMRPMGKGPDFPQEVSVANVCVTADGRRAVAGSSEHAMRVWDLETGICLRMVKETLSVFDSLCLTPDGQLAVSGGLDPTDKRLRVWRLENAECLVTLRNEETDIKGVDLLLKPQRDIRGAYLTLDGRRALSGYGSELRLWDLEKGELVWTLSGHTGDVKDVDVTPDGRWAVSGGFDMTVRLWDMETGDCVVVMTGHRDMVNSVSITPDGRQAISGSSDGTLRLWDLSAGACLRILFGHESDVQSVRVRPDGRQAVSGSDDGTIRVWDLEKGRALQTAGYQSGLSWESMAFMHRYYRGTARMLDLDSRMSSASRTSLTDSPRYATGREKDPNVRWLLQTVNVTPDRRWALSGGSDKTIRVWDLQTGERKFTVKGLERVPTCVHLLSERAAASAADDATVRIWDLQTGDCQAALVGHTDHIETIAVTLDRGRAVSASWDKTLRVWDLRTGACLRTLEGHTDLVLGVTLTLEGRRAVSSSWDKTLRLWDLETGKCLRILEGHTGPVWSVSLTRDGRRAISGSADATLKHWDLESGECLGAFEGHSSGVHGVAITPDGRRVLSASVDRTLGVWDMETRERVALVRGPAPFYSVEYSPPYNRVVGGFADGEIALFDVRGMVWGPMPERTIPPSEDPEKQLRREVAACVQTWGEAHPNTLRTQIGLAELLSTVGKAAESAELYRQTGATCVTLSDGGVVHEIVECLLPALKSNGEIDVLAALRKKFARPIEPSNVTISIPPEPVIDSQDFTKRSKRPISSAQRILEAVVAALESSNLTRCEELLTASPGADKRLQNALAVLRLRQGRISDAVSILRRLLFPGDGIIMDMSAPEIYIVNFAIALALSGNEEGLQSALSQLSKSQHRSVKALRVALGERQARRPLWRRIFGSADRMPLALDILPGEIYLGDGS
jgi:WD40 repeat protein